MSQGAQCSEEGVQEAMEAEGWASHPEEGLGLGTHQLLGLLHSTVGDQDSKSQFFCFTLHILSVSAAPSFQQVWNQHCQHPG